MPSPNYYDVTVSREAGVFKAHIHVQAEGKPNAERKALAEAQKNWDNKKFWKYDEVYFDFIKKPLIQVEDVEVE